MLFGVDNQESKDYVINIELGMMFQSNKIFINKIINNKNMAKRRRYKFDPFFGRYEKGSLIDVLHELDKNLWKESKYSYSFYPKYKRQKERQTSKSKTKFNDLPPKIQLLISFLILSVIIWAFIFKPFIEWVIQNVVTIVIICAIIIGILIIGFIFYWKYKKEKEAEKQAFEEEQKAKGLIKFIDRFGSEKWGKPNDVERWKKEDEEARIKESLFNQVVESIKNFQPSRKYKNEFGYHIELQGWLKSHFQNARVELQTGASRPDIIVDNIAIEVKGPTDNHALNTLTTKCLKYSHYYTHLIIVLFEPIFSESNYNEIVRGIKNYFPNVEIIRKD